MRARILSLAGVLSLVLGLMAGFVRGGQALAQDATPEATPEVATTDATPEASTQNIVTLVAWYQRAADGETLELRPLVISPTYVASAGELGPENLTGTVDFTSSKNKGGQPRITLGDSIFDAYPLEEENYDTVQRWWRRGHERSQRHRLPIENRRADTQLVIAGERLRTRQHLE